MPQRAAGDAALPPVPRLSPPPPPASITTATAAPLQVLDQPEGAPVVRPTMEEARALFPDCTFAAGQTGPSREAPAPMTYEQPAFDQQPAFDAEQQPAFDATA